LKRSANPFHDFLQEAVPPPGAPVNAAQVVGAEHTPVALLERFEDVEKIQPVFRLAMA